MAEAETKAATTVLTKNQKKKKRKYNVKQRFIAAAAEDEQREQKRRLIAAAAEQREQDEQRDQENVELQRSLEQVNHSSKAKMKELEQELERANVRSMRWQMTKHYLKGDSLKSMVNFIKSAINIARWARKLRCVNCAESNIRKVSTVKHLKFKYRRTRSLSSIEL